MINFKWKCCSDIVCAITSGPLPWPLCEKVKECWTDECYSSLWFIPPQSHFTLLFNCHYVTFSNLNVAQQVFVSWFSANMKLRNCCPSQATSQITKATMVSFFSTSYVFPCLIFCYHSLMVWTAALKFRKTEVDYFLIEPLNNTDYSWPLIFQSNIFHPWIGWLPLDHRQLRRPLLPFHSYTCKANGQGFWPLVNLFSFFPLNISFFSFITFSVKLLCNKN